MKEKSSSKKERNRRRKYRLLVLLLLMFATGIMLVTSTYAWFTSNKTVTVSTLKVTIDAKNGLQISTDAQNWKSVISNADITGARATYGDSINQIPTVMEPVSTIGNVDASGLMEMYYGTVGTSDDPATLGDYTLSAVKSTEAEGTSGKFIAFDLFFQVNDTTRIKVTSNSGVTPAKLTPEAATAVDTGIKNASRFAFIVEGNVDLNAGGTLTQIHEAWDGTNATRQIWEPNYDIHTSAAVAHALNTYGISVSSDPADPTNAAAATYYGVKANINAALNIPLNSTDATYFSQVTPAFTTKFGVADFELVTLQKGITKMRIYMWVEGQDVDCENDASGGAINYDLQFTVVEPETP